MIHLRERPKGWDISEHVSLVTDPVLQECRLERKAGRGGKMVGSAAESDGLDSVRWRKHDPRKPGCPLPP